MMEKEYKADSTKGSSMLQPMTYKNDVLVQVWVDSRVLATLSDWLDSQNEFSRHMSEVVRKPLEALVELLVNQGDVEMVDDTALARFTLSKRYGVNLNRGGRGVKNVLHNQLLSDKRKKLNFSFSSKPQVDSTPIGKQKKNVAEGDLNRMVELFESLKGTDNQSKEECIQAALDSGCIVEDEAHQLKKMSKQQDMHDDWLAERQAKDKARALAERDTSGMKIVQNLNELENTDDTKLSHITSMDDGNSDTSND